MIFWNSYSHSPKVKKPEPFDLLGCGGDAQLALVFDVPLQLVDVLSAQADQRLDPLRSALERIGRTVGNARRTETPFDDGQITVQRTCLPSEDRGRAFGIQPVGLGSGVSEAG